MRMRDVLSGTALALCLSVTPAAFAQSTAPIPFAPYRAVYEMALDESVDNKAVEAATGRMVYEATGSICDGYTVKARHIIQLQTENGLHVLDSTTDSYESGDGKTMRFKLESRMDDNIIEKTDGEAIIGEDRDFQIRLTRPQEKRTSVKGDVLLPTTLSEKVIAAAQAGEKTFSAKTYDGAGGGETIYDTFTLIGRRIEPGNVKGVEEAAQAPELQKLARWPIKISYFKRGETGGEAVPDYTMSAELYESGVTRAMRFSFQEFSMKATLKTLSYLPQTACQKK